MIGSILKVLAYRQAPRTTFAMLHPDAAFQLAKMRYDFHHAYAPRVAAVAAAALVLPLGIILGRAMERGARRRSRSAGVPATTGAQPPRARMPAASAMRSPTSSSVSSTRLTAAMRSKEPPMTTRRSRQ